MIPAGSQSPQWTSQGNTATMESNSGNATMGAADYKWRLTPFGAVGRLPQSRRFDVQLAGALQMPLKRRVDRPVSRKAERAFLLEHHGIRCLSFRRLDRAAA